MFLIFKCEHTVTWQRSYQRFWFELSVQKCNIKRHWEKVYFIFNKKRPKFFQAAALVMFRHLPQHLLFFTWAVCRKSNRSPPSPARFSQGKSTKHDHLYFTFFHKYFINKSILIWSKSVLGMYSFLVLAKLCVTVVCVHTEEETVTLRR